MGIRSAFRWRKDTERTKREISERIEQYAAAHFSGKYTRLGIRFRSHFCYIDAYTEPFAQEGWPPDNWPETREEYLERLRNMPTHLCRLRHFDKDRWSFADAFSRSAILYVRMILNAVVN